MDQRSQADEAQRQRERDARSAAIDREVDAEIAHRAERRDMALAADAAEASRLDRLELEQRKAAASTASAEAAASARVRERTQRVSRISRVVTYLFSLVYGLLLIRVVLALMGASTATPFVRLIHGASRPLTAPFEGIASSVTSNPDARLVAPIIVAIVVAALVHAAIIGLFRLYAPRDVAGG